MKLYLISQDVNEAYDTYSTAVVAAESDVEARMTHPDGVRPVKHEADQTWCALNDVKVRYIGEAAKGIEAGVLCSSFHAG